MNLGLRMINQLVCHHVVSVLKPFWALDCFHLWNATTKFDWKATTKFDSTFSTKFGAGNGINVIIHCLFIVYSHSQLFPITTNVTTNSAPWTLGPSCFPPLTAGTQLTISLWFSLWFADVRSSQGKKTCGTGCIWSRLKPQRKQLTPHHLHPHPQRLVFFQAPSYL